MVPHDDHGLDDLFGGLAEMYYHIYDTDHHIYNQKIEQIVNLFSRYSGKLFFLAFY